MATEEEKVSNYTEFMHNVLPRIAKLGYNTIQLMAVMEHPFMVLMAIMSSLFAPTFRFGTPEELKALVERAHEMGIAVIIDLVHSHVVKNFNEGFDLT